MSDAARLQLAAIRDEWLTPLVERIGALERENGDLAGQLAARANVLTAKDETIAELRRRAEVAEAEREALRAELRDWGGLTGEGRIGPTTGPAATEAPPATTPAPAAQGPVQGLWWRLRRRLGGG